MSVSMRRGAALCSRSRRRSYDAFSSAAAASASPVLRAKQSRGAFLQPRGEQARLVLQLGDTLGVRRRRRGERRELALEERDPLRLRQRFPRDQLPVAAHRHLCARASPAPPRSPLERRPRAPSRPAPPGPPPRRAPRRRPSRSPRRAASRAPPSAARAFSPRGGYRAASCARREASPAARSSVEAVESAEAPIEPPALSAARRRLRRRPLDPGGGARQARRIAADRRRSAAAVLFALSFRLARADIRQVLLHFAAHRRPNVVLRLLARVGNLDAVLVPRARAPKPARPGHFSVPRRRRAPLGVATSLFKRKRARVVYAQRVAERRRRHGSRARARGRGARFQKVGRGRVARAGVIPEKSDPASETFSPPSSGVWPVQNGEVRGFAKNRVLAAGAWRARRRPPGPCPEASARARVVAQKRPAGRVFDARLEVRGRPPSSTQLRDLLQLALGDARRREHERVSRRTAPGSLRFAAVRAGAERGRASPRFAPAWRPACAAAPPGPSSRALHLLHRHGLERALVERRRLRGALLRDVVEPWRGLLLKRDLRVVVQLPCASRASPSRCPRLSARASSAATPNDAPPPAVSPALCAWLSCPWCWRASRAPR